MLTTSKSATVFAAAVACVMSLGLTSSNAQTVANGPYYATPSWDQTLPCTALNNCPRFIVLSNMGSAAVLDRETGLVWEKSLDGVNTHSWLGAHVTCNEKTVGNRGGWRLPTIQELRSLIDFDPANTSNPRLPPGHPFANVQGRPFYWSATSVGDSGLAFGSRFDGGTLVAGLSKDSSRLVWCVRGGQGHDAR